MKEMTMNCYMGIDIGTSRCKAVVFDENGKQLSSAHRAYNILSENDGWAELNPDEVIEKCFQVISESANVIKPDIVVSIGISSQGEAFTIIDKNGKTLCNALVSSDTRAKEFATRWANEFGEDKLYRITGHTPHPIFSLFKLLWIKENLPSVWKRTYKVLCFEDLLQYRLGIKNPSIGWSLAGRTMLFDVVRHCWSEEILESIGIKADQLSQPKQSGLVAGYIETNIARQLNLSDRTMVVSGGHDQPCSGLGAGAINKGTAVFSAGTVECITPAFDKPIFSKYLRKYNYCTYDHVVKGLYATVAYSLTGGNLLKWFLDEFGIKEREFANKNESDAYQLLLDQMPLQPTNLLVLPYFTASGTPYFDTSTKGAILGLSLTTKREDILKALLEGVAFEIKLNLEILEEAGYEVNELIAIGGGSKSAQLNQLRADIIDKPITTMDVTEAGCLGVAILAKAAFTDEDVYKTSEKWIKQKETFYPRNQALYTEKYCQYKRNYSLLKQVMQSC